MDEKNVRAWGVAGAAIILAVAAAIALFAVEPTARQAPPADMPRGGAVLVPIAPPGKAKGDPPIQLIARFAASHPLSNAQTLDREGKKAEAAIAATDVLRRRDELRDYCFVRFTVASEIVLTPCAQVAPAMRARVTERHRRQLEALAGVDYVDATIDTLPTTNR